MIFERSTQDPMAGPVLASYRPGETVHDLAHPFRLEVFRTHSFSEAVAALEVARIMER